MCSAMAFIKSGGTLFAIQTPHAVANFPQCRLNEAAGRRTLRVRRSEIHLIWDKLGHRNIFERRSL